MAIVELSLDDLADLGRRELGLLLQRNSPTNLPERPDVMKEGLLRLG